MIDRINNFMKKIFFYDIMIFDCKNCHNLINLLIEDI